MAPEKNLQTKGVLKILIGLMIQAFTLTLGQIRDPKIVKPLLFATLLTIGSIFIFILLGAAVIEWTNDKFSFLLFDLFGKKGGWFRIISHFLGAFLLLIVSYFFFASIHSAFLGIFIDDIFDALVIRHHPLVEFGPRMKMGASIFFSIRFIFLSLLLNLLALPFFVLGWIIPPIGIALQVFLNGYLLGKEYGQLLEFRLPPELQGKKQNYLLNGMISSLFWMIPLVNLLAPVLLAGSILHAKLNSLQRIGK